jgi:hypothetical protein
MGCMPHMQRPEIQQACCLTATLTLHDLVLLVGVQDCMVWWTVASEQ